MGYVVVKAVVCDGCGLSVKDVFKKKVYGENYHRIWAEQNGWEVRKDGWFCPKCRRNKKGV
jgi:rubredoxin